MKNKAFVALGMLSLALGLLGALLPVLPTTPFALLAAWCFSKGSPRLQRWLLQTKLFGPLICDWQAHGVIRPRAKILSTCLILPLFGYTLGFVPIHWAIKVLIAAIGAAVLGFIWSRPTGPKPS